MKKLISIFLAFVLVFTLLPAAVFAYTYGDGCTLDMLPNDPDIRDEAVPILNYNKDDVLPNGRIGVMERFTLEPGLYEVWSKVSPLYDDDDTYVVTYAGLFEDSLLSNPVNSTELSDYHVLTVRSSEGFPRSMIYRVTEEKEYYLATYCDDPDISKMKVYLSFNELRNPNSGIKARIDTRHYGVFPDDTSVSKVFDYTATRTAYLCLNTTAATKITLMTKSGTTVSKQRSAVPQYPVYFGVKKGVKYKLKISWPTTNEYTGPSAEYGYVLSTTKDNFPITGGRTRAKAREMVRSQNMSGLIVAGDSSAKWYKLKLRKKSKINVRIEGGTCDTLKFTLYKGKKILKTKTMSYTSRADVTPLWIKPGSKLAAGLYHLKVQRVGKNSSGWYKLKWRTL